MRLSSTQARFYLRRINGGHTSSHILYKQFATLEYWYWAREDVLYCFNIQDYCSLRMESLPESEGALAWFPRTLRSKLVPGAQETSAL